MIGISDIRYHFSQIIIIRYFFFKVNYNYKEILKKIQWFSQYEIPDQNHTISKANYLKADQSTTLSVNADNLYIDKSI